MISYQTTLPYQDLPAGFYFSPLPVKLGIEEQQKTFWKGTHPVRWKNQPFFANKDDITDPKPIKQA